MTTAYPTALATDLNQTSGDSSGGTSTPSHGGTVLGGHEFDLPIAQQQLSPPGSNNTSMAATPQPPRTAQPSDESDQLQPLPAAIPRSGTINKPRPVSMPPQTSAPGVPPAAASSNGTSDRERSIDEAKRPTPKSGRSSNRILGEYTLSKTLNENEGDGGDNGITFYNRSLEKGRSPVA